MIMLGHFLLVRVFIAMLAGGISVAYAVMGGFLVGLGGMLGISAFLLFFVIIFVSDLGAHIVLPRKQIRERVEALGLENDETKSFRYKLWGPGLITLLVSGFLFLIPVGSPIRNFGLGARKDVTDRERGFVGMARGFLLLIFAGIFALLMAVGNTQTYGIGMVGVTASLALYIYNLLPVRPLEGSHLAEVDNKAWFGMFAIGIVLQLGFIFSLLPFILVFIVGVAVGTAGLPIARMMVTPRQQAVKKVKKQRKVKVQETAFRTVACPDCGTSIRVEDKPGAAVECGNCGAIGYIGTE